MSVQAQVSEVKEQIEDSYDYYEDAFKKIKYAISSIDDCYNTNSIDDIQSYASDAESYLTSAKRYLGYAEVTCKLKKASRTNSTFGFFQR
ncbi:MAG: hypothetical protein L0J49_00190 [Lactococcus lactis]|nr:hypothetical protein [Lactococcus lactis]